MTTVDMEQMLRESTELTPSPQLKSKALTKAVAAMSERASLACREEDNRVPARGILMRRVVALAVCLILVCGITAFGWWISNDSFRIVYVDVNPSVALHVNRFERVCEVEFLNEDAQRILSDVRLNRCTVEDALANIIDACTASGYMDGAAELYISAKDGDALIDRLEDCALQKSDGQYSVNTTQFTDEEQEMARPHGISPGKYRLITSILDVDASYALEDLTKKPMRELKAILQGMQDSTADNQSPENTPDTGCDSNHDTDDCNGSCNGGSGNGNGYGGNHR